MTVLEVGYTRSVVVFANQLVTTMSHHHLVQVIVHQLVCVLRDKY